MHRGPYLAYPRTYPNMCNHVWDAMSAVCTSYGRAFGNFGFSMSCSPSDRFWSACRVLSGWKTATIVLRGSLSTQASGCDAFNASMARLVVLEGRTARELSTQSRHSQPRRHRLLAHKFAHELAVPIVMIFEYGTCPSSKWD